MPVDDAPRNLLIKQHNEGLTIMEILKFYNISVPIEPESELHNRLERTAQMRGISFEKALEEATQMGLWIHVARNLDFIERYSTEPF